MIGLLLQLWIKSSKLLLTGLSASGSIDNAVTLDIRNIEVDPGGVFITSRIERPDTNE